ncbi:MAG: DUF1566 domain-containing protein, partial [Pseudomonadota bacterium]
MLVIGTEGPLEVGRLDITVASQGRVLLSNSYRVPTEARLPTTVAIVSNGVPTGQAEITVVGWQVIDGAAAIPLDRRDRIVTQVPADHVAELDVVLSARCSSKVTLVDGAAKSTCGNGRTCDGTGDCESVQVVATTLASYRPGNEQDPGLRETPSETPIGTAGAAGAADAAGAAGAAGAADATGEGGNPAIVAAAGKAGAGGGMDSGGSGNSAGSQPMASGGTGGSAGSKGSAGSSGSNNVAGAAPVCVDEPVMTTCSAGRCGMQSNNCQHAVLCPANACAAPQSCGGGGSANTCGGCDWTSVYPAAPGCPKGTFGWPCRALPALARAPSDYAVKTLCNDDVVIDSATQLMWARVEEPAAYWAGASQQCANSLRAGFSDWRLPSSGELMSIIDYTKTTTPLLDTSAFRGLDLASAPTNGAVWSAGAFLGNLGGNWVVSFDTGAVDDHRYGGAPPYGVRCVR